MLSTIGQVIVTLLTSLLPMVEQGGSQLIETIIMTLISLIPVAVREEQALLAPIQNIIATLSTNPATTATQFATLQALDAQVDDAFEAAAAAAGAPPPPAAA